jgi:hypothetical protein
VDIKDHKEEKERTRLTVGGDQIEYPGEKSTRTSGLTAAKILTNSVISTLGAKFLVIDIQNFYLNTPLGRFEYMVINLLLLPQETIYKYDLIELAQDGKVSPRLLREGDVLLMGCVVQHRGEFTRAQVIAIKRCRVYFQVISIVDMTSNDRQFILKSYYLGTSDPARHWLQWPRKIKPRNQDWEQWRRALKMLFRTVTTMTLSLPLGPWFGAPLRPTIC